MLELNLEAFKSKRLAVHVAKGWMVDLETLIESGVEPSETLGDTLIRLSQWIENHVIGVVVEAMQKDIDPITPRPTQEQIMPVCGGIYPGGVDKFDHKRIQTRIDAVAGSDMQVREHHKRECCSLDCEGCSGK